MLPRLLSLTMPHIEKKRSTKADDEGILKRIKANLYRLGNVFLLSSQNLILLILLKFLSFIIVLKISFSFSSELRKEDSVSWFSCSSIIVLNSKLKSESISLLFIIVFVDNDDDVDAAVFGIDSIQANKFSNAFFFTCSFQMTF